MVQVFNMPVALPATNQQYQLHDVTGSCYRSTCKPKCLHSATIPDERLRAKSTWHGPTKYHETLRWNRYTPFTRHNRLSIRFDNRLDVCLHDIAGCQTVCTTSLTTVLNEQPLFLQLVVQPGHTTSLTTGCIHDTAGCQTGLTTGWMFVYMIQPVVKPVVSRIQTFNRLSTGFIV